MMITFPSPEDLDLSFRYKSGDFHICDLDEIPRIVEEGKDSCGMIWDLDVWLPSRQVNLQRGLCWTQLQNEQFIWSLLRRRPIPPIFVCDQRQEPANSRFPVKTRQLIDGKQRIHAVYGFLVGQFPIHFKGNPFYRQDLPHEYRFRLEHSSFVGCCAQSNLTEDQLVEWFLQINFAGTPQDEAHYKRLLKEA